MQRKIILGEWLAERNIPHEWVERYTVSTGRHEFGVGYFNNRVTDTEIDGVRFTLDLAEGGGVTRFVAAADKRRHAVVTSTAMRKVNLGHMALAVRAAWALEVELSDMASPGMLEHYRERIGKPETTAGVKVSDELLVAAMEHYVTACENGGATREAAQSFGCSKDDMDNYRKAAIKRKLFETYGGKGTKGGYFTRAGEQLRKGTR